MERHAKNIQTSVTEEHFHLKSVPEPYDHEHVRQCATKLINSKEKAFLSLSHLFYLLYADSS